MIIGPQPSLPGKVMRYRRRFRATWATNALHWEKQTKKNTSPLSPTFFLFPQILATPITTESVCCPTALLNRLHISILEKTENFLSIPIPRARVRGGVVRDDHVGNIYAPKNLCVPKLTLETNKDII